MESVKDKIYSNSGKLTLAGLGAVYTPAIMQNEFRKIGLNGTLKENADKFIKSNGGFFDGAIDIATKGKISLATKISKNKYAKIAFLASIPISAILGGIIVGHSIDRAHKKVEK